MKKYILIVLVLLISCFGFSQVNASIPEIYVTEINIQKDNFVPKENIEGTVSLWNYEEYVMPDLTLRFQLFGEKIDGTPTQIIDDQRQDQVFILSGKEKTTKAFSYNLPMNLPNGELVLRVQVINTKGEEMAWIDKDIMIESDSKFVTLDNHWVIKKEGLTKEMEEYFKLTGEEPGSFNPSMGVLYQPGQKPEVTFDVMNNSSEDISGFYKLSIYKRNVGNVISHENRDVIILEAKKKATQTIFLPEFGEPESYLAELRFFDNETKEQASNIISFRWVIAGNDDAEILFVTADRTTYMKGEEAKIEVNYAGPADGSGFEGNETIEVKLYNYDNEEIGQATSNIDKTNNTMVISVPIKKDVINPKIETQIIKNGKLLDGHSVSLGPKVEEESSFIQENKIIVISVLVALLILLIIIMIVNKSIMKKRQIDISLLLVVAIIGSLFFLNVTESSAVTTVTNGCPSTYLTGLNWISPTAGQSFIPGDTVTFRGRYQSSACLNAPNEIELTFYITEDPGNDPRAIPIKDCGGLDDVDNCGTRLPTDLCAGPNGCTDCYSDRIANAWYCQGGSSATCENLYLHSALVDEVKILDKSKGYKIYELGKRYYDNITNNWQYEDSFQIPDISTLGFAGPARFYIQASDWGWHSNTAIWSWKIDYQKGEIKDELNLKDIEDQEVATGDAFDEIDLDSYVVNGNPPYTWSVTGGNSDMSITINNNKAIITYNPGWTGDETFNFTVTSKTGSTANDSATFTVRPLGNSHAYVVPGSTSTSEDYCISSPIGNVTLNYNYADAEGDKMYSFNIQVDEDSNFNSPIDFQPREELDFDLGRRSFNILVTESPKLKQLRYGQKYYWRVRVKGQGDLVWSDWESGPSFNTPFAPGPNVGWQDVNPKVGEPVTFINETKFYDSTCKADSNNVLCKYFWIFGDETPISSEDKDPSITFSTKGTKIVQLSVTDSSGKTCIKSHNVDVGGGNISPPKWWEVPPFGWLESLLASFYSSF